MHIPVALIVALIVFYFMRNWWIERRRLAVHRRHLQMLYPQTPPEQISQYVRDVYGRR
jgi:hypothetical protein